MPLEEPLQAQKNAVSHLSPQPISRLRHEEAGAVFAEFGLLHLLKYAEGLDMEVWAVKVRRLEDVALYVLFHFRRPNSLSRISRLCLPTYHAPWLNRIEDTQTRWQANTMALRTFSGLALRDTIPMVWATC